MLQFILPLLAGLVLFLYAVINLSETMQAAMGDAAKKWITRFTSHTWSAILTGTLVTFLLDSSSAVIIITIVLINARVVELKQAMGIVMGANIGTTFSSQIIAMNIAQFSPVLLVCGFVLMMLSKSPKLTAAGKSILLFGVLFFGLFTMENAVEPMRTRPEFIEWLKITEHPLQGALLGAFITIIIQSSSATVAMAILLTKKSALSLAGGIAIMLGAELGTCSDTLVATLKGSRMALKTGLFHLLFNFVSISIGLILFPYFVSLVEWMNTGNTTEHTLANAHVLFNVSGVLLFVWFLAPAERALHALLPEREAIS